MDSEEEEEEYEYEDEFDEDAERQGYDDDEIAQKLITENENIERNNYILNQKLKLSIQFNEDLIDPDIYYSSINKLNKELSEIEAYSTDVDRAFVEKELEFNSQINTL